MQRASVLGIGIAIVLLLAIAVLIFRSNRTTANEIAEQQQVLAIMQGFNAAGRQLGGVLPRPGLMGTASATPGGNDERRADNITANVYAVGLALQLFTAPQCVSPREQNPVVQIFASDPVAAYDPANRVYWDPTFAADLEFGSNVSFAHLPLLGARGKKHWRVPGDATFPMLGWRGPHNGELSGASYTLLQDGAWSGAIAFGDGHVEWRTTTERPESNWINDVGQPRVDDMFRDDVGAEQQAVQQRGGQGFDAFLTFTHSLQPQAVWQWD
ncbi:MAG: hypothetical protein ACR2GY_04570 [Phycisphaerales bacterium]